MSNVAIFQSWWYVGDGKKVVKINRGHHDYTGHQSIQVILMKFRTLMHQTVI